jgi:hypothetical protein
LSSLESLIKSILIFLKNKNKNKARSHLVKN